MGSSPPPRRWRSSLRQRWGLASSSCSGSSAEVPHLPNEIALRLAHIGEVHAPAGQEHVHDPNLPADAVGPLLAGLVVGADPQIAALAVADALSRNQPLGTQEW